VPQLIPAKQRQFAVEVVERLRGQGYEALWAGGCVRDELLDRVPKDYDVATSATPDQVRQVFGHRRTLAVGASFGVIVVRGPREAGQIDVATFRRDESYTDGRRPDRVSFSSAEEDARRRDFTINGLFYDPHTQRVIDYVGGQEDIDRRRIRTIGEARERFTEDKLRLLRAVRFAATFDFTLEQQTASEIRAMADQITVVSAERIAQELRGMFRPQGRRRAAELLAETGLLPHVLPEAASTDWPRVVRALEYLDVESFPAVLAAMAGESGDPPRASKAWRGACRRLRLTNRETEQTVWLIERQSRVRQARSMPWPALQRILIHEGAEDLVALEEALARADARPLADVEFCRLRLQWTAELLNPPPLVTGDDLLARGVPRGRIYKQVLDQVRDAQLEGQIATHEEALALVDRLVAGQGGGQGESR